MFPIKQSTVLLAILGLAFVESVIASPQPSRCDPPKPPKPPKTPKPTSTKCDITLCVDYINECGMMYGGCYVVPECGGTVPTFTPPPCPTITSKPTLTPTPTSTKSCDITLCVDKINACGQMFGGCYLIPECGGTVPTFQTPPCDTKTVDPSAKPTCYPGAIC